MVLDTVEKLYGVYRDSLPGALGPTAGTPPAVAQRVGKVDRVLEAIELPSSLAKTRDKDVSLARDEDWKALVTKGIFGKIAQGELSFNRRPLEPELLAAYAPLVDYVRTFFEQQVRDATRATYDLLVRFDRQYQAAKRAAGLFEFDDVATWLADSIDQLGDPAWIGRCLDVPIEHLLLDEFQDTAPLQWRILRPIAESVTRPGQPRSFFCVGDQKQAIYGWRGGVAEVFDLV